MLAVAGGTNYSVRRKLLQASTRFYLLAKLVPE